MSSCTPTTKLMLIHPTASLVRTLITGCTYVLIFLCIYAWALNHPVFLNPDFTTAEDMFRDIFEGAGTLFQWHLPRSSYYLDVLPYFLMRWLGGSPAQGLALYAALQACILIAGAYYALTASGDRHIWAIPVIGFCFVFVVHGSLPIFTWLLGNMAHVMTLGIAMFSIGVLSRHSREYPAWTSLGLCVVALTWCDFVYVLWFTLPALFVLAWQWWRTPALREFSLRTGLWLCAAVGMGRVLDVLTRAYPAARMGSAKLRYILPTLGRMMEDLGLAFAANPIFAVLWGAGVFALLRNAVRDNASVAFVARLALCGMALNALVMALYGMNAAYYYLAFYYIPVFLGVPLFFAMLLERTAGKRCWIFSLAALGGLGWFAVADLRTPHSSLSPPNARCLERFFNAHGPMPFIANYWTAHDRLFTPALKIIMGHVEPATLLPDAMNTNPSTLPESFRAVFLAQTPTWGSIDARQVLRLNGPPAEEFICTENDGGSRIWLYPNGARGADVATLLFRGHEVAPEFAVNDHTLWQGDHAFATGQRLVRAWTGLRWDQRWLVLEFSSTGMSPEGSEIQISFFGNRSPSHRQKAGIQLIRNTGSFLTTLYRLFLHNKTMTVEQSAMHRLANGNIAVFSSIQSRHSSSWPLFDITVNGHEFSLRSEAGESR